MRRSSLAWGAALLLAAALPVRGQVGIIAFGDSITEGTFGDDPARAKKGYPPRLETLLRADGVDASVLNAGRGGENTIEGLTRIDGVLTASSASNDVLLLMEGTNDISNQLSIETTRANLAEMARKAEVSGLSVVHATTIPRYPNATRDASNVTNYTLDETIRNVAGVAGRKLADPFAVFLRLTNLFATYYWVPPQGTTDPVGHPNAAGYDQLAQLFFDVLRDRDRVPPVPGLTIPQHGAEAVAASAPIQVDVWDFGAGIDLANTRLLVNGIDAGVQAVGDTRHAQLSFTPAQPLSGTVRVGLRSRDLATPTPNTTDGDVIRFAVAGGVFLAGDIDRDGRVDGRDLVQFALHFGSQLGSPLFLAAADFNGDHIVDGTDLAMLAANFGRSSA